jgi:hypothetical protein
MTLTEIADRINALFHRYGLDHDVVAVRVLGVRITLDPRENEPDITKWRATDRLVRAPQEQVVFTSADDEEAMALLLATLTFVFDVFFEVQPETGQGRLF